VKEVLDRLKPRAILLLGATATGAHLRPYWQEGIESIGRWRGWNIPLNGTWVCPTYHPSYLLRENDPLLSEIFHKDVETAIDLANQPTPPSPGPALITVMSESGQIINWLKNHRGYAAVDFETTGLKPDRPGHKIWSVGVCAESSGNGLDAAAFRLEGNDVIRAVREWLTAPDVHKIGHNVQFEHRWAKKCLGVSIRPWSADSMLDAHLLDNRSGICGLKFQSFVQFGVGNYDSSIKPFLKAPDSNAFNAVDRAPQEELLRYNGMDALLTYMLSNHQHERMGNCET
jgi:hypothetical protein